MQEQHNSGRARESGLTFGSNRDSVFNETDSEASSEMIRGEASCSDSARGS